jgi:hypothetical protein
MRVIQEGRVGDNGWWVVVIVHSDGNLVSHDSRSVGNATVRSMVVMGKSGANSDGEIGVLVCGWWWR